MYKAGKWEIVMMMRGRRREREHISRDIEKRINIQIYGKQDAVLNKHDSSKCIYNHTLSFQICANRVKQVCHVHCAWTTKWTQNNTFAIYLINNYILRRKSSRFLNASCVCVCVCACYREKRTISLWFSRSYSPASVRVLALSFFHFSILSFYVWVWERANELVHAKNWQFVACCIFSSLARQHFH